MTSAAATVRLLLERVPPDVSLAHVARLADMHPVNLVQLSSGRRKATPLVLSRLRLALARMKARASDGPAAEFCLYQSLLAHAAEALGLPVAEVRASDPAAKVRTPAARAAAQVRWLAFYLMCVGYGLRGVDVARAAGVSKNAVSLALKEIELKRDTDTAFAQMLEGLEQTLMESV